MVIRSKLGSKAAAHAPAIEHQVVFRVFAFRVSYTNCISFEHGMLASFTGTFTKPPVINQHHIIIIAVKILGVFGPALDTAGVSMKIQDQSGRLLPEKMEAVDANAFFHIKKQFTERRIIAEIQNQPIIFRA